MTQSRAAHLAILIGLALSSSRVMAQADPAALPVQTDSATVPVQTDLAAVPVEPDPGALPAQTYPGDVALRAPRIQPATVLPSVNDTVGYTQPTETQKLRRFVNDAIGPLAFVKAAAAGGMAQAANSPEEWGQGWDAYRTRVGSKFATSLVSTTTRYGLAEILHEDTRYYPCQCAGFGPRLGHALASTFTGRRGQDGHTAFSVPKLVAPYAASMTSLAWLPDHPTDHLTAQDGFRMGSTSFLGLVAGNLIREFLHRGPRSPVGQAKSLRETTVAQVAK